MKKALILLTVIGLAAVSCGERNAKRDGGEALTNADTITKVTWNGYTAIAPEEIEGNIIQRLSEDWMLITSGTPGSFNTMTASWGGMGVLWQMPVSFIAVRNTRYTNEFLRENDIYTLSFFDGEQKDALIYLGTHSGRDGDKITPSGLTPMETPLGSMSFEQSVMILECRKIYENKLDPKSVFDNDIADEYLRTKEYHNLFVGEIVNVWVRE